MKKILKITLYFLIIIFGIFMLIFGEFDDSPGAQGIGLIFYIFGIIVLIKNK